jgi:pyruvate/2-oxoglutarate dehydrogenase complex dihydrolipoamide dehydrogenase (E3) component
LEGDAILVAVGRVPNTSQLALEKAGIVVNARGFIEVDEYLRTNVPNIWAIGDVNGGPQFTYISLDDYRIIRDQFDGKSHYSTQVRQNVPSAVFIAPPLAHVGLTEEEALQRDYEIMVGKLPPAALPRAQIMRQTDGLLKAIVNARTNKILGTTLYCADAHEMIQTVQIAMHADMDYRVLRDNIFTHPTMSEALNDLFNLVK